MITHADVEELLNLLTDKFQAFCIENNLPPDEIEELLTREDLTEDQRRSLSAFSHRWETVADLHDVLYWLAPPRPEGPAG